MLSPLHCPHGDINMFYFSHTQKAAAVSISHILLHLLPKPLLLFEAEPIEIINYLTGPNSFYSLLGFL